MFKIICNEDIIINILGPEAKKGIKVESIPKDIGLERLRWDGKKVVDLADLNGMWIREVGFNFFEYHAVEVPHSIFIKIGYNDRKKLYSSKSGVKVYTSEEFDSTIEISAKSLANTKELKILTRRIKSELTLDTIEDFVNTTFKSLTKKECNALVDLYKLLYFLLGRTI